MLPGIKERAYLIADISQPANPKEAGRWWIPARRRRRNAARLEAVSRRAFSRSRRDSARDRSTSRWSTPAWSYRHFRHKQTQDDQPDRLEPAVRRLCPHDFAAAGRKLVVAVDESVKYDCNEGEKRVWIIDIREEKNR